ncbi:MAG: exo-alpha-sialidase, partial [Bryobacterales bacterium]|nr:exo-alpha-sialidase [Bryobacterales bacterium]
MKRLLLTALCFAPLLAPAGSVTILERATVFTHTGTNPRDAANATGFNHAPSVTVLPDGRILTAWFSGPFEGSARQKILGAASSDHGRTWRAPSTLHDFPGRADFDPAFIVDGSRTLLLFSSGLRRTYPFETGQQGPVGDEHHRIYLRISPDSGRTWTAPREIGGEAAHTPRTNGIRLATGELLVPIHRLGTKAGGVLRSTDGGKTWTRHGFVANPAGEGGEPTIAELGSGRVLMLLRTRDGELWRAFSEDKGATWSTPEKTGLPAGATSHNVIRTRRGKLVLTHNP